ncbi:MAG TPA: prepilin peptidase [Firmicutes bacterium]|nr:prepilin peptidase [Bacillota bacterium]
MKRYFCVFVLLMLFLLTACKDDSLSVTSDGESVAASDLAAAGCVHEPVNDPRVEPTCTEPGQTEGTHCALCGEVLSGHTEIPAAGHMPETAERQEPTCTAPGFVGEVRCTVCGEVLEEEQTLPVLGHTTENGRCTRCGQYIGGVWETRYYVDQFDQPTEDWYISCRAVGKFSNSATVDDELEAQVLADSTGDITFFLYEYGSYQVKNHSSGDWQEYVVTMRSAAGDLRMTGAMYAGGDRIFLDAVYVPSVLEALRGEGTVMFHIVPVEAYVTETEYLFSVEASNFADEYGRMTGADV